MDESFSDFKKKKKCNTGPKNTQKAKAKTINRKPLKKSKSQKDIRVFVKGKENEVVSYTKKFSEICKNSLDVDSEQLQLAIALSKSLLQSGSLTSGHNSKEEKHLSSLERTAKIKLTLEEYGFKVPNAKINSNKRKRLKKQYKLLILSEQEKKQIIIDKYVTILETNHYKSLEEAFHCNYKQSELFYKATNITFQNIKNNEIFYVKDLGLEISHNISLLRDWSQIPGRPLSPTIEVNNFKFVDINLKQEELDLILTGNLRNIKDIIKNKNTDHIKSTETIMGAENTEFCIDDDVEVANFIKQSNSSSSSNFKDISYINGLSTIQNMISVQRNISPDIFDEDITILEYTTLAKTTDATYDKKDNERCFMDLTECVAITNFDSCKSITNLHHKNNRSKRKSNDYMDITECVTSSKQMSVHIDLTQQFVPFNKSKDNKNSNNKTTLNIDDIETMDLTQSSKSDVETEIVEEKDIGNDSSDDTIIINDNNDMRDIIILCDKSIAADNNTIKDQSTCKEFQNNNSVLSATESSETVPIEMKNNIPMEENICTPTYTYTDHVFEHSYIYDYDNFDDNEEIGVSNSCSDEDNVVKNSTQDCSTKSNVICTENSNFNKKSSSSHINETTVNHGKIIMENCKLSTNNVNDLSGSYKEKHEHLQISRCYTGKNEISSVAKQNNSEETDTRNIILNITDENINEENHVSPSEDYNDYVFEHSYTYNCDDGNSPIMKQNDDNENEINLTQTSDVESTEIEIKNNLGKIDNISVDYDDIIVVENVNSNISKSSSLAHCKEASNCSKSSEIFEVSDKEFNYSLHQSRFNNYDADGFDDIHKTAKNPRSFNRSMSENDLNIKGNSKKTKSDHLSYNTTPVKALSQDVKSAVVLTPNNDYIIKTHGVTPMADYSSMSSPERNEELKKYGLKPFKRKRAIQLLTYLYNQTHPVVESYEETSSPAKRLKYDTPKQKSPKKSPKKRLITKSPLKSCNLGNIEEMNNLLYIKTKDLPDIKDIHCDPEDWVFQTREKSKVHLCRVPLHIAFHNYITCRRYLRESMLRYEPINIDVIHKELVSIGYRYNPKDLLKFMDKKCITVKTTDSNARNRR